MHIGEASELFIGPKVNFGLTRGRRWDREQLLCDLRVSAHHSVNDYPPPGAHFPAGPRLECGGNLQRSAQGLLVFLKPPVAPTPIGRRVEIMHMPTPQTALPLVRSAYGAIAWIQGQFRKSVAT